MAIAQWILGIAALVVIVGCVLRAGFYFVGTDSTARGFMMLAMAVVMTMVCMGALVLIPRIAQTGAKKAGVDTPAQLFPAQNE